MGYSRNAMKTLYIPAASALLLYLTTVATLAGAGLTPAPAQGQRQAQPAVAPAPPPPPQPGHPSGRLVLWGDVALFSTPDDPDNCILTNRFKRGQRIGFRMTAFDGGTGET